MTLLHNAIGARAQSDAGCVRLPVRQRGVVLFIALIMLVAMTLAGIAMVRSVDTTLGIAGNLAFRQTTIQSADQAVKTAFDWLNNNPTLLTGNVAAGTSGYYEVNSNPDWFNISAWNQAVLLSGGTADAAGNVTRYVIHRMCNFTGPVDPLTCQTYKSSTVAGNQSHNIGAAQYTGTVQTYYRVSVRVDGPRNTTSVTQAFIIL